MGGEDENLFHGFWAFRLNLSWKIGEITLIPMVALLNSVCIHGIRNINNYSYVFTQDKNPARDGKQKHQFLKRPQGQVQKDRPRII
jgi:hypothetical protein